MCIAGVERLGIAKFLNVYAAGGKNLRSSGGWNPKMQERWIIG